MNAQIKIPTDKIAAFCRRNHIQRMALFGSVLRDDFTPDSDVDVLVDFESGQAPGLEFFSLQDELSGILGRQVDLCTFKGIESSRNWLLREEILNSVDVLYEQTR